VLCGRRILLSNEARTSEPMQTVTDKGQGRDDRTKNESKSNFKPPRRLVLFTLPAAPRELHAVRRTSAHTGASSNCTPHPSDPRPDTTRSRERPRKKRRNKESKGAKYRVRCMSHSVFVARCVATKNEELRKRASIRLPRRHTNDNQTAAHALGLARQLQPHDTRSPSAGERTIKRTSLRKETNKKKRARRTPDH
jgi:hypothetical protein